MPDLLDEKFTELQGRGVTPAVIKNLVDHLRSAPPAGLFRLSAAFFAERWGLPALEVLEGFLHATRLGILDMYWLVRCPDCSFGASSALNLAKLHPEAHCEACEKDIYARFDEHVEVLFRVNSDFQGGAARPSSKEVIEYWGLTSALDSLHLDAGETRHYQRDLLPGVYVLHPVDYAGDTTMVVNSQVDGGAQASNITYDGEHVRRRPVQHYASGRFDLSFENRSQQAVDLYLSVIPRRPWTSGMQVVTTQVFRDLFSSELIMQDESFAISSQAFVFTDIKGSTELYERLGDARAYLLVRQHYKLLTDIVRQHQGAVIKTVGDEIMAVFARSQDAMQAVLRMQAAFDQFNSSNREVGEIILKVGLHSGPCIAVTLNERLDYFGRTVNLAARTQALSTGRDIVMTAAFFANPQIQAIVSESGWQVQHTHTSLRGIQERYPLVRLTNPLSQPD